MTKWTSLAHAVRWLAEGVEPKSLEEIDATEDRPSISSEEYQAAKQQLTLAVFREQVPIQFRLIAREVFKPAKDPVHPKDPEALPNSADQDWITFLSGWPAQKIMAPDGGHWMPEEPFPVPGALFKQRHINWQFCSLSCVTRDGFVVWMSEPRVAKEALMKVFAKTLIADTAGTIAGSGPETSRQRPGRPENEIWKRFYTELIVRADLDGLPDTQAECIRMMLDWIEDQQDVPEDKRPKESSVQKRISPIYQHVKKRKN